MQKRLLLNLRHVPDDEVEEVLALLETHGIEHYLTPAGPFGISAGGIWLRHDEDCVRARAVFDDYQKDRAMRAHRDRQEEKERGEQDTLASMWRRRPWHVTAMVILSLVILMIFFAPMLQIAQTVR